MNDTKNDTIPTMTFASERDPSKLYSVAFSNNGTFNCSCLDFRYSGLVERLRAALRVHRSRGDNSQLPEGDQIK